MKRASMYQAHEKSLSNFADAFNAVIDCHPIVMQIYHVENYRDDGVIVNTKTGERICFDWEIRDNYFARGKFQFKTAGQFERKLKKDEIGLSIQCASDQSAFLVAWHQDWLKETSVMRKLKTDIPQRKKEAIRYTRHYKVYSYMEINQFRGMIANALALHLFNHNVFKDR